LEEIPVDVQPDIKESKASKGCMHRIISSQHSASHILFSVLALESIITGSALGVAADKLSVIVILIAILTHIWAESFALTAAYLKSEMELKKFIEC